MSHPKNKLERFEVGVAKSKNRVMFFLSYRSSSITKEFLSIWSRKFRNTTKKCSCVMCGNARKFNNELSIQEIRYGQGNLYPDE